MQNSSEDQPEVLTKRHRQLTGHSACERWASLVLDACTSEGDLRTLTDWSRFSGLSYTSLREACRVLRIKPHDARDFARMLRVAVKGLREDCPAEALLDVRDERTLRLLLMRAGLDDRRRGFRSVDEFLQHQQFIPCDHPALRAVRVRICG